MITKPIFFERNRVGRVYTGGKLFANFFSDDAIDGYEPEEWIASSVKAINRVQKCEKEGISKIKGQELYFDELLAKYGEQMLGEGKKMRILVKVLDSAIRLPAQAHPDKTFSKENFGAPYGKTECWIILDTRPDAKIFFGFKDGVGKADFERAILESEHSTTAMEKLMKSIKAEKDAVYFVPAKTVHAIGAGCLILEIQEPTDFTIQPERFCGEYKLSDEEMYIGLSKEKALECFDFKSDVNAEKTPSVRLNENNVTVESLINEADTDCFVINRITLKGGSFLLNLDDNYGIYIVTKGNAIIKGNGYEKRLKKGDYFFMPAVAMGNFEISGNAEIIECY